MLYAHQPDGSGRQACYGSFDIATGASTDPVSETYGLDVTTMPLTETFSTGLMVVQYDPNEGFSRNYKYVSWVDVMNLPD